MDSISHNSINHEGRSHPWKSSDINVSMDLGPVDGRAIVDEYQSLKNAVAEVYPGPFETVKLGNKDLISSQVKLQFSNTALPGTKNAHIPAQSQWIDDDPSTEDHIYLWNINSGPEPGQYYPEDVPGNPVAQEAVRDGKSLCGESVHINYDEKEGFIRKDVNYDLTTFKKSYLSTMLAFGELRGRIEEIKVDRTIVVNEQTGEVVEDNLEKKYI